MSSCAELLLLSCLWLFSLDYVCKNVKGNPPPFFPTVQNMTGQLDRLESHQIDKSREIFFQFAINKESENFVMETQVGNGTTIEYPITFEVRQQKFSESWQLPWETSLGYVYHSANKTVCINDHLPSYLRIGGSKRRNVNATGNIVTVTVSTLSPSQVSFTLLVRNICHLIPISQSREVQVTATSPQLMHFHFLPKEKSTSSAVIVSLSSNDTRCMTVSVQKPECPFHGNEKSVVYEGNRHTMTKKGAVTVRRDDYPVGFFLVLVLHSRDMNCLRTGTEDSGEDEEIRVKTVQVIIKESISDTDFYHGWIYPLIVCIIGFIVTLGVFCAMYFLRNRETEKGNPAGPQQSPSLQTVTSFQTYPHPSNGNSCGTSNVQLMETEERPPPQKFVRLSQLTGKPYEKLEKRNKLFVCTVLIVAFYYTLPAIQLVYMHLRTSHSTGNLDLCYYNFECAHPLGWISDFNHLYSNIGYLAAGLSALILLAGLETYHSSYRVEGKGIPPHFGISKALAWAIFFEGVLSASYHVCPNRSNFHHDTCFMFVAGTLTALKLYQARHPDTNVSAPTAFLILGGLMLLDLIGELWESPYYFIIFTFCFHLTALCMLAVKLIFFGYPPIFSREILKPIWQNEGTITLTADKQQPVAGRDVLILIILGVAVNIGICLGFGSFSQPIPDFGGYILKVLIGNVVLYLLYYLAMKCVHGEVTNAWKRSKTSLIICIFLLIAATLLWHFAGSYFSDIKTSWEETPAESRILNEPCKFFDSHDWWHLLSALALFTTLIALELLDLDLMNDSHESIIVF